MRAAGGLNAKAVVNEDHPEQAEGRLERPFVKGGASVGDNQVGSQNTSDPAMRLYALDIACPSGRTGSKRPRVVYEKCRVCACRLA